MAWVDVMFDLLRPLESLKADVYSTLDPIIAGQGCFKQMPFTKLQLSISRLRVAVLYCALTPNLERLLRHDAKLREGFCRLLTTTQLAVGSSHCVFITDSVLYRDGGTVGRNATVVSYQLIAASIRTANQSYYMAMAEHGYIRVLDLLRTDVRCVKHSTATRYQLFHRIVSPFNGDSYNIVISDSIILLLSALSHCSESLLLGQSFANTLFIIDPNFERQVVTICDVAPMTRALLKKTRPFSYTNNSMLLYLMLLFSRILGLAPHSFPLLDPNTRYCTSTYMSRLHHRIVHVYPKAIVPIIFRRSLKHKSAWIYRLRYMAYLVFNLRYWHARLYLPTDENCMRVETVDGTEWLPVSMNGNRSIF